MVSTPRHTRFACQRCRIADVIDVRSICCSRLVGVVNPTERCIDEELLVHERRRTLQHDAVVEGGRLEGEGSVLTDQVARHATVLRIDVVAAVAARGLRSAEHRQGQVVILIDVPRQLADVLRRLLIGVVPLLRARQRRRLLEARLFVDDRIQRRTRHRIRRELELIQRTVQVHALQCNLEAGEEPEFVFDDRTTDREAKVANRAE
jgi:hypothetical protein